MCPDLVGGRTFSPERMTSHGVDGTMGGGKGQGGTDFGVGVGHLVELMPHVSLYPLEGLASV